jgi:hypothetical protein
MYDTLSLQPMALNLWQRFWQHSAKFTQPQPQQALAVPQPRSIGGRVRAELSVVAVEGSKTFGASQDVPATIAVDDNGREVTFGAEARA